MGWGRLSVFAVAFALFAVPAAAADRVALVIGNGAYQKVAALPNPPRDATDIAAALQRLEFKVTLLTNLTGAQTRKALVEFGHAVETANIAAVFYAGHGMEIGGENWLIPIDAELLSDTDVESEAISLRSINLQVGKATQLGLVILDACRNNPFAVKMRRSLSVRSVARGLAPTEPTENVLIAYAARDGTTASDGNGRNSPFTTALLRHIETPGLEISFLFRRVRDDVMAATQREQQPFVYGSLSKDEIYLRPAATTTSAPKLVATPSPAPTEDEQFWQAIRTSNVPGLYEEFLSRYPSSRLTAEARARLADLRAEQATTASHPDSNTPANGGGGEAAQSFKSSKVHPFTTEDRERVAAWAAELKLRMPPFTIPSEETKPPNSYSRFVGVWSNKRGWGNGKGRTGMLLIAKVSDTGLASGYYLWGPPTKASWKQSPAGYVEFAEYLFGDTLIFKTDETITAKLDSQNVLTLSASRARSSEKSGIELRPIWQLVGPNINDTRSTPASAAKAGKAAAGAVSHREAGDRELAKDTQPREAPDEVRAQCRREAHRLQSNDTSRIEACVRNGGRI
ncbi:caspase family protein [Bradyrhizobium oligotrophicum]|uniref:caspase family protein n=1 Tax=Bradyrhizobium oligotrophicum TaxID=44255 RepID=UPI003EC012F0